MYVCMYVYIYIYTYKRKRVEPPTVKPRSSTGVRVDAITRTCDNEHGNECTLQSFRALRRIGKRVEPPTVNPRSSTGVRVDAMTRT